MGWLSLILNSSLIQISGLEFFGPSEPLAWRSLNYNIVLERDLHSAESSLGGSGFQRCIGFTSSLLLGVPQDPNHWILSRDPVSG